MLGCMSDEDDKRIRETVLAERERRRKLAREVEERPLQEDEERSMPKAPDA
jgi:hypothetical protein